MEETKNGVPMSEDECVITPPHSMAEMQKRIDRTGKIVAIVIIALSALLLVMAFVMLVLSFMTHLAENPSKDLDVGTPSFLVVLAIFLLFFGSFFYQSLRRNENFEARRNYEERIRFTKEFAEVMTYRKGEVIGKEKLYYTDLFAVRQKKDLLHIYITAASAHVVDLSKLPPADVATLHDYLRF